ncbi:MAG: 6-phosphogluconolactonase [Anaerorhabdus sp.]|uniref:6-phosphogluconolactonase n=1 Tax=Anaerorhabdus sp. TaxID=1872524 RepID=UPI002FC8B0F5
MKFIVTKDFEELSQVMSQYMLKHMHTNKERANISITTGRTPVRGYEILAPQIKNKTYFKNVHYYIFDEFWYKNDSVGICRASLDREFFKPANISDNNIHNLDDGNVDTFDEDIQKSGGLDMIIMGVGTNGHFCGNQPGTFKTWDEKTRRIDRHTNKIIEDLLEFLLKDDLHSNDYSRIPNHYISMGPKTVMMAKSIVFIMSGKEKAATVKKAFFEPIDTNFPVSIFQLHPNVTVIIDEDAASEVKELI